MVDLVQGRPAAEPRARTSRPSAGTSGRAAMLVQHRVAESGRPRRGLALRGGLNYSMTGVFYNKDAGRADRDDRAARDARRVRGAARRRPRTPASSRSCSGTPSPSGGGLAFPLQNLMAALGPTEPDQRLDLPEGGRHDRHADQPGGRPAPRAVDQGGLLPGRRQRHRVHRGERALRAAARACSCSTATGRTPATTLTAPGNDRLLPVPARRGGRQARRDVGAR